MIQGKDILNIFQQLKKDGSFVNLRLLGTDYERLTIVTGIEKQDNEMFFLIDYPKGFRPAADKIDMWELRFEFNGRDKVQYIFKTFGGEIVGKNIRLNFPETMERIQRREYFRIEVPLATKIYISVNSVDIELDMIDISIRGASGMCVKFSDDMFLAQFIKTKEELRDIELVFPSQSETNIYIKKARVKRIEENSFTNHYHYGFEFIDIDASEEKDLVKIIYELQRKLLQKRQRIYNS